MVAPLITFGEMAVGIGLLIGLLTGFAAFFGALMNMSFLLAGSASTNPVLFTLAIGLMLAWKVAGYYGVDRWLLPMLGTPWHPGPIPTGGGSTPPPTPTAPTHKPGGRTAPSSSNAPGLRQRTGVFDSGQWSADRSTGSRIGGLAGPDRPSIAETRPFEQATGDLARSARSSGSIGSRSARVMSAV